jgi:phosphoheptose isomerase
MTSARSINDSAQLKDLSQVAIEAIRAGNHVILFGNGVSVDEVDLVLHALEQEYQDSASFRAQVDAALLKVLNLKR